MDATARLPEPEYQPGVCNIGGPEVARRMRMGWIGSALTLVIGVIMLTLSTPWWSFAVLFLTAFLAATGFIQARSKFCAGFGMHGMSQFGAIGDDPAVAAAEEAIAADKARAKLITRQAAFVGVFVAAIFGAAAQVLS